MCFIRLFMHGHPSLGAAIVWLVAVRARNGLSLTRFLSLRVLFSVYSQFFNKLLSTNLIILFYNISIQLLFSLFFFSAHLCTRIMFSQVFRFYVYIQNWNKHKSISVNDPIRVWLWYNNRGSMGIKNLLLIKGLGYLWWIWRYWFTGIIALIWKLISIKYFSRVLFDSLL